MKTVIGGYLIGSDGGRNQFGPFCDPTGGLIEQLVERFAGSNGVLVLRVDPTPETGPYELNLYADRQAFLLMLSEIGDDGDETVRTLFSTDREDSLSSLFGEPYPNAAITHDLEVVKRVFKEFAATGNVSRRLLD